MNKLNFFPGNLQKFFQYSLLKIVFYKKMFFFLINLNFKALYIGVFYHITILSCKHIGAAFKKNNFSTDMIYCSSMKTFSVRNFSFNSSLVGLPLNNLIFSFLHFSRKKMIVFYLNNKWVAFIRNSYSKFLLPRF